MIAHAWVALALGMALMAGGATAMSALGAMNGDCDQTQDKLQLKDGSCDTCPDELVTLEDDSCNEYLYDWDFLYGTPGPHQSAVGQE